MKSQRGSTLTEFALAWPVILLLVLAAIQIAVYGVEAYAAREAALVGARVGSEAGSGPGPATAAALRSIAPALAGVDAVAWCPATLGGSGSAPPRWVWICATDDGADIGMRVGGEVPAVVPLPFVPALPISAEAFLAKEVFRP